MKRALFSGAILLVMTLSIACNRTETMTPLPEYLTVTETATAVGTTVATTTTVVTITATEAIELTQGQAYAVAAKVVPSSVLGADSIVTLSGLRESHGIYSSVWTTWFSSLRGYLTTKQELLDFGWQADASTTFGETDAYAQVVIEVDAGSGEVIQKTAFNGYPTGGVPGRLT